MTAAPVAGLDPRSRWVFRSGAMVCAVLLGMQCMWLLLPELLRPKIDQLPIDAIAASAAAKHYDAALWAASVGRIRGDLWAEAAFTHADLMWRNRAKGDGNIAAALQRARTSLDQALRNAPHISGAWLMFADLASRFPSLGGDAIELLKLSYYTGPSNQELVPLRLETAIRLESFSDFEVRQLISRDIRLLLSQKRDATIAKIYNTASANAKSFMEQTIRDIDPSAVDKFRASGQKQLELPH
jgi:hypothetical protein